ncbi:helix-turn-helix transcriptional regulator [Streptacidiphilus sp. N1-12]|uniref:Helix-turn-helix transcriptional regulator n=2 Tax=Streptacidiphilus alkalitolerans TaxID=3342712 RepID=A0ABV6V9E9_9ACTN
MQRRDGGAPIREAMAAAGLKIDALAAATKAVDPAGRGVGRATIGFVVATGASARERMSDRAATLLADALGAPVERLFAPDDISMPAEYASTSRTGTTGAVETGTARKTRRAPRSSAEPLLTLAEEAELIGRSKSWFYEMRRLYPRAHATPFPIHYAGKSPRFIHSEVVAWMDAAFPMGLAA